MIEKKFNTGLLNLNYVEGSTNGPALLLLHANVMQWQSFNSVIPELDKRWHLYALDLRGRGKSDWAKSYRIEDHASDVVSFIKECIKEPTIIFGHSIGGMIGLMVAASNPELVKALIIGDSLLSIESLIKMSENQKDTTVFWRDLVKTKSVEVITSGLKNQLIPVPNLDELVPAHKVYGENHPYFQFFAECLSQLDPEMLTANIDYIDDSYYEYKTEKLFPRVQCPVLILQANPELGGLIRDEDAGKALSLLPKAHRVKLNNIGHGLHLEDRESVIKATVNFLDSIDALM